MKEHPILFSGPMVRAILEGRKTQTRRVVSALLNWVETASYCKDGWGTGARERKRRWCFNDEVALFSHTRDCPYGEPGDRLWVRETFTFGRVTRGDITDRPFQRVRGGNQPALYRADGLYNDDKHRWKPSIFMPRWASRITLEVVSVRVERLQEISEADAIAEGIEVTEVTDVYSLLGRRTGERRTHYKFYGKELERLKQQTSNAVWSYQTLWDSINGDNSWKANPWVWVIEFRRLEGRAA